MIEEFNRVFKAIAEFKSQHPDVELNFAQSVPCQRPFTERLLMCFIWASPNLKRTDPFVTRNKDEGKPRRRGESQKGNPTDEQMLSNAYKAIYGDKPSTMPQKKYDYGLLSNMESRKYFQQIDVAEGRRKKVDSDRKLAAAALSEQNKGQAERLRKSFPKFEQERAELDPEMLIALEVIQRLVLELVEAAVRPLGVPFYAYD